MSHNLFVWAGILVCFSAMGSKMIFQIDWNLWYAISQVTMLWTIIRSGTKSVYGVMSMMYMSQIDRWYLPPMAPFTNMD